ncbi:MAG: U32 family peptidase [Oscillospiraceae bacterium]|nr:U32 family peptidase [Oscillospiraceae bacterium]
MMNNNISPELLAPAGSIESIYAACACGADAVYIGGQNFSARANAVNFSDEELAEAVDYCHLRGVKVYQALNTVIFDHELLDFSDAAIRSAETGVDAFIVQDLGAARILKAVLPDMPLHASTQLSVHTPEGALMARELGFERVVPARELSLKEIKAICDTGIETEVFVHGALCMCVSGQCYMSAVIGSRSANRGQCAQACRLPFSAVGGREERHDLSLKDMSHIESIDKLIKCGVSSLKIEGRMKRAEYTAAAVTACRQVLDGEKPDMESLRAVFSRSGFTDGYISGGMGKAMFGYRRKDDVTAAAEVLPQMKELYRNEAPRYKVNMHIEIAEGRPSLLTAESEGCTATVSGDIPQAAVNRPTDTELCQKQLSRLGGTVFELDKLTADIGEGLILPVSALNKLRREAAEMLSEEIIASRRPDYTINEPDAYSEEFGDIYTEPKKHEKRVHIRHRAVLDAALAYGDCVVLPMSECHGIEHDRERIIIAPPRFTSDEKSVIHELTQLKADGFSRLYCNNIAHIRYGKRLGFRLHGGYGLNTANSYSVSALKDMGLEDITASFEMKLHDISALADLTGIAVIVYGRLPLMLVRNCPVKQAAGCGKCTGKITDRTGRSFEVICDKGKREYSEILNCDTLYMTDRISEIHGASIYDYFFYDSSADALTEKTAELDKGTKPDKSVTRGLYYRGVI